MEKVCGTEIYYEVPEGSDRNFIENEQRKNRIEKQIREEEMRKMQIKQQSEKLRIGNEIIEDEMRSKILIKK